MLLRRNESGFAVLVLVGLAAEAGPPLPVMLALLILATVVAVVSPVAAGAAVAAAVPFEFHPAQLGSSRFSLLELAIVVGCVGIGVNLARRVPSRGLGEAIQVLWGHWEPSVVAVLLLVTGAFSLLHVADPRHLAESVRELRLVIVEPVAALAVTRWTLRHGGARLFVVALVGIGACVAIAAGIQILLGQGEVIGNGVPRATGPYPHPNNLALYLERVGLFAGALALADRRLRRTALPATVVVAVGLAATLSRGALLAVLVGGGLAIVLVRPARGWRRFGAAAAVVLAGFAVFAGDRLWATGTSGGTSTREFVWHASLRMIRDHPIFGVGLDQFLYQYAPRYVSPAGWPERYTSHPHNLVLDVWLSLGLPGLAVFAGLAIVAVRLIERLRHSGERSQEWRLAVAGAAMLVGGAAHGLVDNGFFLPDLAVLTWMAVAFIERASPRHEKAKGGEP